MSAGPITPTESTTIRRLPAARRVDVGVDRRDPRRGLRVPRRVRRLPTAGPYVIPTAYGRVDDVLFLHGSPASRMLRTLAGGVDICVTVTLVDGFVLARSSFHHSLNYRSVVVLGRAVEEKDPAAKAAALNAFVDHVVDGSRRRLPRRRPPSRCARPSCCGSRCARRRRRSGPGPRSTSPKISSCRSGAESFRSGCTRARPSPTGSGTAGRFRDRRTSRTNGPARAARTRARELGQAGCDQMSEWSPRGRFRSTRRVASRRRRVDDGRVLAACSQLDEDGRRPTTTVDARPTATAAPCHPPDDRPGQGRRRRRGRRATHVITSFDGAQIHVHWFPLAAPPRTRSADRAHGTGLGIGRRHQHDDAPAAQGFIVDQGPARRRLQRAHLGSTRLRQVDRHDRDRQRRSSKAATSSASSTGSRPSPASQLDAPGDPRVGMVGASYGGGIQLTTAAIDCRVDAIVPSWAWNSLDDEPLQGRDTSKSGWSTLLYGAAAGRKLDPHIVSAQQRRRPRPARIDAADHAWFARPRARRPRRADPRSRRSSCRAPSTRCSRSTKRSRTTRSCAATACRPR